MHTQARFVLELACGLPDLLFPFREEWLHSIDNGPSDFLQIFAGCDKNVHCLFKLISVAESNGPDVGALRWKDPPQGKIAGIQFPDGLICNFLHFFDSQGSQPPWVFLSVVAGKRTRGFHETNAHLGEVI